MKSLDFLTTIISLAIFIGGIVLLLSPVSFWSYVLGVPAIQIGIVFLITSYERLSRKQIEDELKEYD